MSHFIMKNKTLWLMTILMLVVVVACGDDSEDPTNTPVPVESPGEIPRATLAPPSTTKTPDSPSAPAPTTAPPGEVEELSFVYEITWELKENDPAFALATVVIDANGGVEPYTYYRDDFEVEGPIFQYEWAVCQGNPGSLRVDSADGQSAREEYFETPPCPTPTPS